MPDTTTPLLLRVDRGVRSSVRPVLSRVPGYDHGAASPDPDSDKVSLLSGPVAGDSSGGPMRIWV